MFNSNKWEISKFHGEITWKLTCIQHKQKLVMLIDTTENTVILVSNMIEQQQNTNWTDKGRQNIFSETVDFWK